MKYVDLRSDTVTWPTEEMRQVMAEAEVGDDVYGDDPTVRKLEVLAAEMVGKEAALFVPSGTFGNQLALLVHTTRGQEVLIPADCHVLEHEVGAASVIAGVQLRPIPHKNGVMDLEILKATIRSDDIHYPETGLIWLENAHSFGTVVPIEHMAEVKKIAESHSLKVHLDGARIFNAAVALGVDAKEIAKYADSVMFCLSKGLCAPVGSILAGDEEFIRRARKKRKLMGGGMRQVGIIAAAGVVALEKMTKRLREDHERAKRLAELLDTISGISVMRDRLDINMVFFKFTKPVNDGAFVSYMLENGVKINPPEPGGVYRFVTHYWIDESAVERAVQLVEEFLKTTS
ncbi:MAG: low-specificity L-threonine aldolase [Thermotogae bacterium]|nr:low-specificity L-threonine aldolase [Thermotogota bacterium]